MSDNSASAQLNVDRDKYTSTKAASGARSIHNGDPVAIGLAGLTLEEVYDVAVSMTGETAKDLAASYGHLNVGMQRMNLGNRIRGAISAITADADAAEAEGKRRPADGEATFNKVVAPFRKAADKRVSDAPASKTAPKATGAKPAPKATGAKPAAKRRSKAKAA